MRKTLLIPTFFLLISILVLFFYNNKKTTVQELQSKITVSKSNHLEYNKINLNCDFVHGHNCNITKAAGNAWLSEVCVWNYNSGNGNVPQTDITTKPSHDIDFDVIWNVKLTCIDNNGQIYFWEQDDKK